MIFAGNSDSMQYNMNELVRNNSGTMLEYIVVHRQPYRRRTLDASDRLLSPAIYLTSNQYNVRR